MYSMTTKANNLGKEIKRLLDMRGWSQRTLASNANIGQSTVSKIIRGETGTTPETISAIANAFEVPSMRLMQIAGVPLQVTKQENRTSSVEYVARKLDKLPAELQKRAVDVIKPQIEVFYEIWELSNQQKRAEEQIPSPKPSKPAEKYDKQGPNSQPEEHNRELFELLTKSDQDDLNRLRVEKPEDYEKLTAILRRAIEVLYRNHDQIKQQADVLP